MKNVLEFSKQLLLDNLNEDAIVVDATVGNGNDTLFLCENFKKVYGFDIQKQAIDSTKSKLSEFDNYELFHSSHENVLDYVDKCDGAIFNLGYLPNFDHTITTKHSSTINAVKSLISIIEKGIIVIVVYTGHDNGEEAAGIEEYLSTIDKRYDVLKYQFINRSAAPYILAIRIK